MNIQEEINYWQNKFRIIKNWEITYQKDDEFTGQVHCGYKTRKATICPWGAGDMAEDYIFHEILHICMGEIKYNRHPYKKNREAEELFIQDLCVILKGENYGLE